MIHFQSYRSIKAALELPTSTKTTNLKKDLHPLAIALPRVSSGTEPFQPSSWLDDPLPKSSFCQSRSGTSPFYEITTADLHPLAIALRRVSAGSEQFQPSSRLDDQLPKISRPIKAALELSTSTKLPRPICIRLLSRFQESQLAPIHFNHLHG